MTLPRRLDAFLPTLLVAAFSASAAQGREFVPAPNEPCGIKCPGPDAPMSRTNFPPRDDNFSRMFVPTETGLELVRNPDWNGKESSMDEWCGITCPERLCTPQFRKPASQERRLAVDVRAHRVRLQDGSQSELGDRRSY